MPLAVRIAFSIAYVLTPSTKQYAAINAIPMVLNSDEAAEASREVTELLGLASEWAKEQLKTEK